MAAPCMLPYPDRFFAAVAFASSPPQGARPVGDEARLLLYALYQQATQGACKAPKPWAWNVVESAKWASWASLGDLDVLEAMRLYVRALEQDNGDWWALCTDNGAPERVAAATAAAAAAAAAARGGAGGIGSAAAGSAESGAAAAPGAPLPRGLGALAPRHDEWAQLRCGGPRPRRRYEHACAVAGGHLLIFGGSCNGRALSDAHALDLATLTWAPLPLRRADGTAGAPPARAGAAAVAWSGSDSDNGALLLVGGLIKGAPPDAPLEVLTVQADGVWAALVTRGAAPPARAGHTCHVIGGSLWLIGGEDAKRRVTADVARLDLRSGEWSGAVATRGAAPPARSGHVSCAHRGVIYVFGGVGVSGECSAALAALDTSSLTWQAPCVASGAAPAARAGAASALLGDTWFIVGGGDGAAPAAETLALHIASGGAAGTPALLTWRVAARVGHRSPLAAEGLSCADAGGGALLAFGGYNGTYSDEVSLLKPGGGDAGGGAQTESEQQAPAAPCAAASTAPASPPPPDAQRRASAPAAAAAAAAEPPATPPPPPSPAPAATPGATTAAAELQLMRRQLAAAQRALAEAEAAAAAHATANAALRSQLDAEQLRALRAEAEAAELRGLLEAARQSVAELEVERRHVEAAAAAEAQAEAAAPRRGGVWAYVTGQ